MVCAYCGIERIWPDDFPARYYAKCRICYHDDRKMKRRRKGWFKKAKKKFVKKRVYRWCFYFAGRDYDLERYQSGRFSMKYRDRDATFQQLENIKILGFVKGFWKARSMAHNSESWCFYFDKRIEE